MKMKDLDAMRDKMSHNYAKQLRAGEANGIVLGWNAAIEQVCITLYKCDGETCGNFLKELESQ